MAILQLQMPRHVTGVDNDRYDRSISERVFIIDINGDVFNAVESYEPEFRYGNLFNSSLREIAVSAGRVRSIALSQERIQHFCHQCPYFRQLSRDLCGQRD